MEEAPCNKGKNCEGQSIFYELGKKKKKKKRKSELPKFPHPASFMLCQVGNNFTNNFNILRKSLVILFILTKDLFKAYTIDSISSAATSNWRNSPGQKDLFQSFWCKTQIGNRTKTTKALQNKKEQAFGKFYESYNSKALMQCTTSKL